MNLKLKEVLPNPVKDSDKTGLFEDMFSVEPWTKFFDPQIFDIELFGKYGEKVISPLTEMFLDDENVLDVFNLSQYLVKKYHYNWLHLLDIMNLEYNPIENYNSQENEQNTSNINRTGNINVTRTGNRTGENSNTQTNDLTDTTTESVYGFNSTEPNLASKTDTTNTGTVKNDETTSETNSGTEKTDTSDGEIGSNTRTLSRKGNIGVTTSQQMIQSEIDLWQWNVIHNIVDMVQKELTISIYFEEDLL